MRRTKLPKTNHYEAVEFLGEGLNSCVYRGFRKTHEDLPRQEVAIKVFKQSKEVQDFEQRFQKLVKVRSRYCAGLLGWEIIGDSVAIIMDYVHGVSLNALVNDVDLSFQKKNEIVAQLQQAIEELHAYDVIHGDLSGANIMIDDQGQLKLIDYGFGQSVEASEVVGSPRFLSPSRWDGQAATQADDLFSCELIARDLKTGTLSKKESHSRLRERAQKVQMSMVREFETKRQQTRACRYAIGELVQRQLMEKAQAFRPRALTTLISKANTLVLSGTSLIEFNYNKVASTAVVFLGVIFPTLSGEIGVATNYVEVKKNSSIEIRTEKWFEVFINGQSLGYTPIRTENMEAGTYTLKWRGSERSGVKSIYLKSGEHLILSDGDLLSRP